MEAKASSVGACFFCAASSDGYICMDCKNDLFDFRSQRCPVCAARSPGSRICGHCLASPPAYDVTTVIADYRYPLDRYIQSLKFRYRFELLKALGEVFLDSVTDRADQWPQALIPVPLHPHRQRQRGFNQAALFAQHLGKNLKLPVIADGLKKHRNTAPQSRLTTAQRRNNVKQAFSLALPFTPAHVAICDDVVTTGATVNEVAKLLRASGCQEIEVWALARTPA